MIKTKLIQATIQLHSCYYGLPCLESIRADELILASNEVNSRKAAELMYKL